MNKYYGLVRLGSTDCYVYMHIHSKEWLTISEEDNSLVLMEAYTVFSESLQHYTKMRKADCTDYSIYGTQLELKLNNFVLLINTTPAAC